MIVMPANSTGIEFGRLCGRYPRSMGHLLSPGAARGPWPWLPYALDNGAFSAFTKGIPFDEQAFLAHCEWALGTGPQPLWVVVPDVVADGAATLAKWREWAPVLRRFGWPLAFAAQDGHQPGDVPADADVVFIGGSTEWKLQAIRPFCAAHRRVHVGRVNTYGRLRICADAGAESCDGTGWFRGDKTQLAGLLTFLGEEAGEIFRTKQSMIIGGA